jgi:hypothetical protein
MKREVEHWRALAAEALAFAAQLTDPVAKSMMVEIASGYEKLAKRAEALERDAGSKK